LGSDPTLALLESPGWEEYELLDSGMGAKLERFGSFTFIRPEHQAMWKPALAEKHWKSADAVFQASSEESGGNWIFNRTIPASWPMQYKGLRFMAHASNSRHLGVFPEQASHWDWIGTKIQDARKPVRVLNLFGYTGLASLAAAKAGASVTHVDASKKSVIWAKENQRLSGLEQRPVRWIVEDAMKFIHREARRGSIYDGLILDPPKFGRGPKGEVWEVFTLLPDLLKACRSVLAPEPLFLIITAYAIRASALSLYYAVEEVMADASGSTSAGELVIKEKSGDRLLSAAIFVRWSTQASSKE
jgi:23S rRNA (cytosine1962-C5)-methyltransferase